MEAKVLKRGTRMGKEKKFEAKKIFPSNISYIPREYSMPW